jgi:hypothetical protein
MMASKHIKKEKGMKAIRTIKGVVPGDGYPSDKVMGLRFSGWDKFPDMFAGEDKAVEEYNKDMAEFTE